MNLIILKLIFSFLMPTLTGYFGLSYLLGNIRLPSNLKLALGYCLGQGYLALIMFLMGTLHITYSFHSLLLPQVLLLIFAFSASYRNRSLKPFKISQTKENNHPLLTAFRIVLLTYILLTVQLSMVRTLNIPINTFDAVATVAFKGKIFYYEQSLPNLNILPHKTYPLFIPFIQAWTSFSIGFWNDQFVKLMFPILLIAYLVIQYNIVALLSTKSHGLVSCALLLSSNFLFFHSTISYRDLYLMGFNCATILLLSLWQKYPFKRLLLVCSLFAGLTTFIKLEGTAFLCIYTMLFLIILFTGKITQKIINTLIFIVPSGAICFAFHIYKLILGATKEGTGIIDKTSVSINLSRLSVIPNILNSFFENLFLSGNWNIVWAVGALSLFYAFHSKNKKPLIIIGTGLMLFFGLYSAVALFTANYEWIAGGLNYTTLSRLILHFFPLIAVFISLAYDPEKK